MWKVRNTRTSSMLHACPVPGGTSSPGDDVVELYGRTPATGTMGSADAMQIVSAPTKERPTMRTAHHDARMTFVRRIIDRYGTAPLPS